VWVEVSRWSDPLFWEVCQLFVIYVIKEMNCEMKRPGGLIGKKLKILKQQMKSTRNITQCSYIPVSVPLRYSKLQYTGSFISPSSNARSRYTALARTMLKHSSYFIK
jgi:hypothetical protein